MTLKPCPLCGGEAKTEWVDEFYYCLSHVQCTACAARGPRSSNEAEAEEAWNTRVIPDGYVKVVRCGECRWWGKHKEVDDDGVERGLCSVLDGEYWCDSPFTLPTHYCSAGEPKEDTNA